MRLHESFCLFWEICEFLTRLRESRRTDTLRAIQMATMRSFVWKPLQISLNLRMKHSAQLAKRFGAVVKENSIKQFVGWYIRKIMEGRGFSLDQQNCKVCSPNNVFTRAARYRRNAPVDID